MPHRSDRRGYRRSGPPTRRLFVLAGVLFAAVAAHGCAGSDGPPQRIVLITIDTLRADHLGCYGYPRGASPFLDDLARESVVFEQVISSCSHTAPSHASLFTSLQPAQHRLLVNGERLDDRLLTIAEVLSDQGYRTAAFTPMLFLAGLEAGFDHFDATDQYEPASGVFDRALQYLESVGDESPTFVWIHLFDVHEWRSPKRLDRASVQWVVQNSEPRRQELTSWLQQENGLPSDLRGFKMSIVQAVNRYDGQLYSVDQALASFYRELGVRELLDQSVWFITSDHGEGLGNHHYLGHGRSLYDEQIRVPLLVHSPRGRFLNGRVAGSVRLVDVAPTIAALAGTSLERQSIPVVGHSLLDLLNGRDDHWQVTEAFAQRRPADQRRIDEGWTPGDVYATRSSDRKLIISSEGPCELYDLKADPFELENRCDPTDPSVEEIMRLLSEAFEVMGSQGEGVQSGTASPEVIEQLKALGYL